MSSNPHILTIDLGTGGPKVALFTQTGDLVHHAFAPTPIKLLPDGGAEQDPNDWWKAICTATKTLFAESKVPANQVAAINVTAQWSGTVALDKAGNPVSDAIIWMDSRGAPMIKQLAEGFPKVEGYAVSKVLKWLRLTAGAPGMSGKDPLAHILWFKEKRPELYAKTHKFLEPKDYLNFRLTGKAESTFETITLHWVTDNRNIEDIRYHEGLLKMTGLDREKLPDLKPTNSKLGKIHPDAARDLDLSESVEVISGCPDLHSAAVGSGAVRDFEAHLYVGTSSWLTCHVPFKKTDIDHNMASLPSGIPGRYFIANEQETAGECVDFLRDHLLYPEDEMSAEKAPEDFYQRLADLVESVPAGADKLIFFPWLYGERSPIEDHHVRGGFWNMSLGHKRAHLARAVLEGVAFNSRWLLMYVEKMCKKKLESINIIGGGAQSKVWCQIFADVLDRPIRQVEAPILANARGAAFLAANALGWMKLEDIPEKITVQQTFWPQPENRKVYDSLFEEFTRFYKQNKKGFARLNASH